MLPLLLLTASTVTLRIVVGGFEASVANRTATPFVFSTEATQLVIYHQAPDGRRTALTWDGSNAEMLPLRPFDTVYLLPGATYTLRRAVEPHRRAWLAKKGVVYAVVFPLRAVAFAAEFWREAARAPLLRTELRSPPLAAGR